MSHLADRVVRDIEEEVDQIDAFRSRLMFSTSESGWIRCDRCGIRLELKEVVQQVRPTKYDIDQFLRNIDDDQEMVLKLYLLGALRRECRCSFGKNNSNTLQSSPPLLEGHKHP